MVKTSDIQIHRLIKQSGMGLIEILISITLGLMILAGVLQMYATSSQNSQVTEANSRIQENMRYVLSRIKNDVIHSGNLGCISFQQDFDSTAPGFYTEDNETVFNFLNTTTGRYQWDQFIEGTDNSGLGNSDTITVRYVKPAVRLTARTDSANPNSFQVLLDPSEPGYNNLAQYQIAVLSNCSTSIVFMITNDPSTSSGVIKFEAKPTDISPSGAINEGQSNNLARIQAFDFESLKNFMSDSQAGTPLYLYAGDSIGSFTYSINTAAGATTTCSTANPQSCALFRDSNTTAPEELVSGVSNLQILYGQAVGSQTSAVSAATANWSDVDRITLSLDINSIDTVSSNNGLELINKNVSHTIILANQIE